MNRRILEKQMEEQLGTVGMRIIQPSRKKGMVRLSEVAQEILLNAPVERLMELHEKYNDDFICEDGKIKIALTK